MIPLFDFAEGLGDPVELLGLGEVFTAVHDEEEGFVVDYLVVGLIHEFEEILLLVDGEVDELVDVAEEALFGQEAALGFVQGLEEVVVADLLSDGLLA